MFPIGYVLLYRFDFSDVFMKGDEVGIFLRRCRITVDDIFVCDEIYDVSYTDLWMNNGIKYYKHYTVYTEA